MTLSVSDLELLLRTLYQSKLRSKNPLMANMMDASLPSPTLDFDYSIESMSEAVSEAIIPYFLSALGIDDLTDVDTSTVAPLAGQGLIWNSSFSHWEPGSISAITAGIDDLTDVDTSTVAPTDAQVLTWSAADSEWVPADLPLVVAAIGDLTDVDTTTVAPTDGQHLSWSSAGSEWVPQSPLDPTSINIGDLADVDMSVAPTLGQVLTWGGATWAPGTVSLVASIDDLTDVDTTTVAPTDGQALLWSTSGSEWIPGTVVAGIGDLSDVDTTTTAPTDGQVLTWNASGSEWIPGAPGGGGATTLDDLTDVDTSTVAPVDGQALVWSAAGSEWIPGDVCGGALPVESAVDVVVANTIGGSNLFLLDATSGDVDLQLPSIAALLCDYAVVWLQKADTSSNVVTMTRDGSDTLKDGTAVLTLVSQHEIIGVQANPAGSDWVLLSHTDPGAMVRSDEAGSDIIGSSGSPTTLTSADTYVAQSGVTDVRDYSRAVWYVTCTNKGTATKLTVTLEWFEDAGTNNAPQGAELITAGAAVLDVYEAGYDISGLAAPFNLPPIALDVIGPNARLSVKADIGSTTEVYARVWRKA